jgi:hypothetical protein
MKKGRQLNLIVIIIAMGLLYACSDNSSRTKKQKPPSVLLNITIYISIIYMNFFNLITIKYTL